MRVIIRNAELDMIVSGAKGNQDIEDFVAFSRFDDDGVIGQICANFGALCGRYLADDL